MSTTFHSVGVDTFHSVGVDTFHSVGVNTFQSVGVNTFQSVGVNTFPFFPCISFFLILSNFSSYMELLNLSGFII